MEWEELAKKDKVKSKVLKYIMFKKRTEQEVRMKFKQQIEENENLFEDIISELKEQKYIDDGDYIKRSIDEYMALNTLSIKEIKYKLLNKGIQKRLIEDYIDKTYEELKEYELNSAKKIYEKKIKQIEENEIKQYLLRKGYNFEIIEEIKSER